jgi:hypothetical protein
LKPWHCGSSIVSQSYQTHRRSKILIVGELINSISFETECFNALLPIVAGADLKVIALCMSDSGVPETVDDRIAIADKLINVLLQNNVPKYGSAA